MLASKRQRRRFHRRQSLHTQLAVAQPQAEAEPQAQGGRQDGGQRRGPDGVIAVFAATDGSELRRQGGDTINLLGLFLLKEV